MRTGWSVLLFQTAIHFKTACHQGLRCSRFATLTHRQLRVDPFAGQLRSRLFLYADLVRAPLSRCFDSKLHTRDHLMGCATTAQQGPPSVTTSTPTAFPLDIGTAPSIQIKGVVQTDMLLAGRLSLPCSCTPWLLSSPATIHPCRYLMPRQVNHRCQL